MDVVPFAKAIQNYSKELRDNHVDMFANGISLPGLAKNFYRVTCTKVLCTI